MSSDEPEDTTGCCLGDILGDKMMKKKGLPCNKRRVLYIPIGSRS